MKDTSNNEGLFDMIDKAINLYNDNKDMIKEVVPDEERLKIDEKSPLREAIVSDDEVIVVVEVKDESLNNIVVDDSPEDGVIVGMNNQTVKAEVPSDVDIDKTEVSLNNGVLEVKIPREGGEE